MDCYPDLARGSAKEWSLNLDLFNMTGNGTFKAENMTNMLDPWSVINSSRSPNGFQSNTSLDIAREVLGTIIIPAICIFGLIGNSLTLVVLTRKRLKSSCDGTERTVNIGLIALAVSDLLCCLCLLPPGLFSKGSHFTYPTLSFVMIYIGYGEAFVNTFMLTSTWLTVIMATSRYLAICHPFRARHLIGLTGTRVSIAIVFVGSVIFNIPRFFYKNIEVIPCKNNKEKHYMLTPAGYMSRHNKVHIAYIWVYFTIGIFLPLAMLAFCNICLVKALRESSKLRKRYRVPAAHVDSNYRITSILVTIVVMYILLVSPCEIVRFIDKRNSEERLIAWSMGVEITNVFQTINFACNFVLYYILNVHFRSAMKDLFMMLWCCPRRCFGDDKRDRRRSHPLNPKPSLSRNTSNTTNTFV